MVQIFQLIHRDQYEKEAGGSGAELGYYPQEGSPYGFRLTNFLNPLGTPCWNPPYGTLSAYDMTSGELVWKKPFGMVQKWGFYMPGSWDSPTIGGPVLMAGGVLFIGASMDARVRAIDALSGEELWRDDVQAPAVATPAVYNY